ncbi:MAG: molybdate ABC transporter permease subunit [Deltaproteobacteria bacterium]|nr:molybdate ABC transporter permease subunit [Deltaproteobacteria bacterium]
MTGGEALEMTLLTLRVAAVATLASAPAAIALGYALARRRLPAIPVIEAVIALPMVLPPVAVGLALLLLLGPNGPLGALFARMGVEIVFTWWAAVLAAAVVGFPLLVRACEQSFAEVDPRYEQMSRTLGAGPVATFFRVTLPMARRGVLYGSLLSFSRAMGEFGATALVAGILPGRTETLALGIWSRVQVGDDRGALALCAASFALALAAMLTAELFLRRERR